MIGYSRAFNELYGPKPIEGKSKMNERIKQLADQAELTIRTSIGTYMSHPEFNKKFAELIIQECADVCESFGESGDGYTCSAEILEHFGVEE